MDESKVEEFGRLLVRFVRDRSVRSCEGQLRFNARSPMAKRWREASDKQAAMVPDCVDETIYHLLHAIDEERIRLIFASENGEMIDLGRDGLGELAGRFLASGGWRSQYATERVNDDFVDLA